MLERLLDQAGEALDSGRPHRAIELLKRGVRRDPYWVEGHRLLGEIYLIEVEHACYALVQFRKLRHVKGRLDFEENVALAWAYAERDFQDRALQVLQQLPDQKPDTVQYLGNQYGTDSLLKTIRGDVTATLKDRQDEFYAKNLRKGQDFLELGDWFQAQKCLERALDIKDTPEVRLEYGRCLLKRQRYPRAVRMLKSIQSDPDVGSRAQSLLGEVYRRLGISVPSENDPSPETVPAKRIAS